MHAVVRNFIVVTKQEIPLILLLTVFLIHNVILTSLSVYLLTVPVNVMFVKLWGLAVSRQDEILIKNLHDSAWNSLQDFFSDTLSAACELTMLFLSISVTFSATCLTVESLITKSCQQRWPIHSCSFCKVVHLQIWW